MAISGSLQDVSVADVMQFVYIGQQTGGLHLTRESEEVIFLFDHGRMVRARSPHSQNLGDVLIGRGDITQGELDEALARRAAEDATRAMGQFLVGLNLISSTQLSEALEIQIQQAINGVLNWEDGSFEFRVGEVETPDAFSSINEILVPADGLNPQMLLLEAARIFDERGEEIAGSGERDASEAETPRQVLDEAAAMGDALRTTEGWRRMLDALFDGEGGARPLTELWWVSQDTAFFRRLSKTLASKPIQARRVGSATARRLDPSGPEPLIFVDLRGGGLSIEELGALRRSHDEATLVAIVDPEQDSAHVFAAGAHALLPADLAAIATFVEHVLPERRPSPERRPAGTSGVQRLRRVFDELRAGLVSATVALNLMRLISESYDRAVLFLAKRDAFSVLGAFGVGAAGRPMVEATKGLALQNDGEDAFSRTLRSSDGPRIEPTLEALPEEFRRVLGDGPIGELSIFSIGGAERVIGLVYADHPTPLPGEEIQILELAAAQVGIALENEMLRRKMAESAKAASARAASAAAQGA